MTYPEICAIIKQSCQNDYFCGSCPIAREKLSQVPEFQDIKNSRVVSFSPSNRTAILITPVFDPQNHPNRLVLASVRKGIYRKLITRSDLSHLKKNQ